MEGIRGDDPTDGAITLISSYRLRPEADRSEFIEWARNVDIPVSRALPGVHRFEMYIVTRDDSKPEYSVIEIFELEAEDSLEKGSGSSLTARDWEQFADPSSVRNVFCRRID
ncbi:MAG TPA: hypothetical protein VD833_10500 [Vicinamibacterales bacterium]|nr:hypothetical protein [Vicinamibacterales bacterium]